MCQLTDYFPDEIARSAARSAQWTQAAVAALLAEQQAGAETPMRELRLPGFSGIRFLLKDESAHPSGSLKHRLARSLLLHALRDGRLGPGQAVVDASSGSTAISEAWYARRLGIAFHAVMPRGTAIAKQDAVAAFGGQCVLVDPGDDMTAVASELARDTDACYLDQFGLASPATDWRGSHGLAAGILAQCRIAVADEPAWIVCGAGTGGTSASLGRHLRHVGSASRVCVADPVGSAFARGWRHGDRGALATRPTCIEGIGRPRVEPCFAFDLVDAIAEVDDAASIAGAWCLERWTGRRFGGSSGTNLAAALELAAGMLARGERGTIVLVLGDRGERYADTLFDPAWVARQGMRPEPWRRALDRTARTGAATGTADLSRAPLRPAGDYAASARHSRGERPQWDLKARESAASLP